MKKSAVRLTFATAATLAGAMIGLGGCHNNNEEPQAGVYGAPEWFDGKDDEPVNTVYGPPEWFEGEVVEPQPVVYGPPEYFEDGKKEP